jgi:hypothetical protein|tara:strand:- start:1246 stop:1407 length:162 start_codon:yes stop_codon:yes gene_type:complete
MEIWRSYSVIIEKQGKILKTIQYGETNGYIIKDIMNLLKKKYSEKNGYRVKLI